MKPAFDRAYHENLRERLVENATTHYLSFGGEYYPWTIEHIAEACGQYPQDVFSSSHEMSKWVYEYWAEIANEHAEKDIPCCEELFKDGLIDSVGAR